MRNSNNCPWIVVEWYEICHSTWTIIINPMQPLCKWPGTLQITAFCTGSTVWQWSNILLILRLFSTIACRMCCSASQLQWAKRFRVGRIPNIMTTSHQSSSPKLPCTLLCFRTSYCGKWAGLNMKQEEMFIIATHSVIFSLIQQCLQQGERVVFFFLCLSSPACSQCTSVVCCAC